MTARSCYTCLHQICFFSTKAVDRYCVRDPKRQEPSKAGVCGEWEEKEPKNA